MKNNRTARRERWWQHAERAPSLYEAIADLDRVLVVARVSKTCLPVFTRSGQVMNEKTVVFPTSDSSVLSLLSSGIHTSWAWQRSSTLKADLNYAPSDVYETLPQPALDASPDLDELGKLLDATRSRTMLGRQLGLTKLYNAVHDSSVQDDEVRQLRDLHEQIDHAVAKAYGWSDLDLTHGFHQTGHGERWTFDLAVNTELLDRLLELNHDRYATEIAASQRSRRSNVSMMEAATDTLF